MASHCRRIDKVSLYYSGIFPCFFGGFLSRLVSSISSA